MKKIALALAAFSVPSAFVQSSTLSSAQLAQLDTVVVSATRVERNLNDAPIRTEVVSRYELDQTHARSLKEALENVPGLQLREIHGKSGFEASMQGMSSDQLLILIDGMPLAASTGSSVDLSQFSTLDIERIEIIKGAASAQYGSSAMGGVINIITRQAGAGLRGSLRYDAGTFGQQNTNGKTAHIAQHNLSTMLEGGSETLTARLSADVRNSEGFDADRNTWGREGDDSQRKQVSLQTNWKPRSGSYLGAEYQRFEEQDKQWLAENNGYFPNKTEDIARNRIHFNAGHLFSSGTAVSLKTLIERYQSDSIKSDYGQGNLYDARHMQLDTEFASLQLDLPNEFLGLTRHQFQIGADYRHEKLGQLVDGKSETGAHENVNRTNYELFLQDDYFFSDQGELVLGLRVQDDSDFGLHSSPKAALKYRFFEDDKQQLLFRASIGTGYRVPNLKERYYTFDHSSIGYMVMGSTDLVPETSTGVQVGALWQFSRHSHIDFNLFYNDINDLIQTDETKSTVNQDGLMVFSYENISRAETYGMETVLNSQVTPSVRANVSHTYTKANNKTTRLTLTNKPEHIARIGVDWNITDHWDVSLRGRYQSRELTTTNPTHSNDILILNNSDLSWSPAWATVDVKTSWQVLPQLRAFGGVDNLTNKQRDFSTGTDFGPIIGRFIYLGFELKANFL